MLIEDIIREANPARSTYKKLAIFTGRLQPPHQGHLKAWQWMREQFDDAFITTSDTTDPERSPLNFKDKQSLLRFAGVPNDRIVRVQSPYKSRELTEKYDPERTVVIYGVSEKDMDSDPRFQFTPKKDGSPSYMQAFSDHRGDLKPFSQHSYIVTVPTFEFKVAGRPMTSATEFRSRFANATDQLQEKMIQDLYGEYDHTVHQLMREKIVKQ